MSSSSVYSAGGEWEVLWNRLRAANDGKTEVTLTPAQVGVLCSEVQGLMRRSGVAWDSLTMRLYRPCETCYSPTDPPAVDCPVCKGAGSIPVQVDMNKIASFIGSMTVAGISREVKRLSKEESDDGK
jgi:hypothetical protein